MPKILPIEEFGRQLIETQDLDPVYVAIVGAQLPRDQLRRLLLAYWCFYHLGSAAWLSEHMGLNFWDWMLTAARNQDAPIDNPSVKRWPRAPERRHFRGAACVAAILYMASRYRRPENHIELLEVSDNAEQVSNTIRSLPMFGPWIAFKAADMLERCMGIPIDFPDDLCLVYESPKQGLIKLAKQRGKTVEDEFLRLTKHFAKYRAPPLFDRPCGPQEVETVLCKWKSHSDGKYQVGKDIDELRHALVGWGKTADKLLQASPSRVLMKGEFE